MAMHDCRKNTQVSIVYGAIKIATAKHLSLVTNMFIAGDERVYRWQRMHLTLATNAFIAGNERVYHWRQRHLFLATKAFIAGDKHVYM